MNLATPLTDRIAQLTKGRVAIDPVAVLDRSRWVALTPPGAVSANGSCRLIRAADAWMAVNLPRAEDRELLPAWIGVDEDADAATIDRAMAGRSSTDLLPDAALLGLAVTRVGETERVSALPDIAGGRRRDRPARRVVDLSTLWAGPLCASILAAAGLEVVKVESAARPDPVRTATPGFDAALNGAKARSTIDFGQPGLLLETIAGADIVVTSARSRAFDALGVTPDIVRRRYPDLTWIAITGHGWSGEGAARVGFGDDCAVAGGLVAWSGDRPHFMGDALADPLTGLAAAIVALETLDLGGATIDAALARTAAGMA